jgi:hypothetical protein
MGDDQARRLANAERSLAEARAEAHYIIKYAQRHLTQARLDAHQLVKTAERTLKDERQRLA